MNGDATGISVQDDRVGEQGEGEFRPGGQAEGGVGAGGRQQGGDDLRREDVGDSGERGDSGPTWVAGRS